MNKKLVTTVATFLIGVLLGTPIVNYAYASFSKTIEVIAGINIEVDGEKFIPKNVDGKEVEVFVYGGTTYVPIRAISEIYGSDIKWNGESKTVSLKTGKNLYARVIYPLIDKKTINEIKNGKHTSFFNSDSVVYDYLEQEKIEYKKESLKKNKISDDMFKYSIVYKNKNKKKEIYIEKFPLQYDKNKLTIWGVTKVLEKPNEKLPAFKIDSKYYLDKDELEDIKIRNLIIEKMKNEGIKGNINSKLKVKKLVNNEIFDNSKTELYIVNLDYAQFNGIAVVKDNKVVTILNGMPIENVFLADLDNDNMYEIYANIFFGSGIISEDILGYNIATNKSYKLSKRGFDNLHLYVNDDILKVEIKPYNRENGNKSFGYLTIENNNGQEELVIK